MDHKMDRQYLLIMTLSMIRPVIYGNIGIDTKNLRMAMGESYHVVAE
jgi:hypothetical protein